MKRIKRGLLEVIRRREGAKARFTILTWTQWNKQPKVKAKKYSPAEAKDAYSAYKQAKATEATALGLTVQSN